MAHDQNDPGHDFSEVAFEGDEHRSAPLPIAPLDHAGRLACLRLARTPSIGPATYRKLINRFGSADAAIAALPELAAEAGRRRPLPVPSLAVVEAELAAAHACGATPVFTIEPGYPRHLIHIDTPPPVLYLKGRTDLLSQPAVAIVGSRQPDANGIAIARKFAVELGARGCLVVSGLARGIDAAAHHASLETGTVGVVAGGIDIQYPPENSELQDAIGENGLLVAEHPPGLSPRGKDFPRRNRIISGMSLGVVVIQAAFRSGSLITADYAINQNREVMAVPGHPFDPRAHGPNRLIRDGATLVRSVDDILEALATTLDHARKSHTDSEQVTGRRELSSEPEPVEPRQPLVSRPPDQTPSSAGDSGGDGDGADNRATIMRHLGPAPTDIDDLIRATGLDAHVVRATLIDLELSRQIQRVDGRAFARKP